MNQKKGTQITLAKARQLSGLGPSAFEKARRAVKNNGVVCYAKDDPTVAIAIVSKGPTSRYFLSLLTPSEETRNVGGGSHNVTTDNKTAEVSVHSEKVGDGASEATTTALSE